MPHEQKEEQYDTNAARTRSETQGRKAEEATTSKPVATHTQDKRDS